jgi:hypothetical protein
VDFTPVYEAARECGVTNNELLDACRRLDIPASRVASKLRPDQVKRLRTHFAGKRKYLGQGRSTSSRRPPEPVRTLIPVLKLHPRDAAMWNVSEVAEIPTIPNGCACCGMRFPREPGDRNQRHCFDCQAHYPQDGEDSERELARLRDHDARLRPGFAAAWHQQSRYEGRMKSAMDSRDKWKAALAEVVLTHEEADDGGCKACHGTKFPCGTWRKLEEANPGIHRKIEALAGLPDEELKRVLYGDDDDV